MLKYNSGEGQSGMADDKREKRRVDGASGSGGTGENGGGRD